MVTLHHFTHPQWLEEMGGWENEAVSSYFQIYVQKVVEAIREYVSLWCTFNEPNIFASLGYLQALFPPGVTSIRSFYRVVQNLIIAHSKAYETIHMIQPEARVGIAHHFRGFSPNEIRSPLDSMMANLVTNNFNNLFPDVFNTGVLNFFGFHKSFPDAKRTQDFFGLNYYTCESVSFSISSPITFFSKTTKNPTSGLSPNGLTPSEHETFFKGLKWANSYGLQIYITENGTEDKNDDDVFRRNYLIQHIHQIWRGINFNWPIQGYYHWTLVDNFEWERGWSQRYGLWKLDIETQSRHKRPSADLYQAICKSNSISSTIISEFSPDLMPILFPG